MKSFQKFFVRLVVFVLVSCPVLWLLGVPWRGLVDNVRLFDAGFFIYLPIAVLSFLIFGALFIPYCLGKLGQEFTLLGGIVKVLGEALAIAGAYVLASRVAGNLVQYDDFYRLYLLCLLINLSAIAYHKLMAKGPVIWERIAALVGVGISLLALASSGFSQNNSGEN